jgi:mannose-6-phosphate isomerase
MTITAAAPIFVGPVFQERVWGGTALRDWYPGVIPAGRIGEAWAISGMPGNSGQVVAGPGAGGTLEQAWRAGLITGSPQDDDFPLLAKLLDPADWLSVQVHPNDEQAAEVEGLPNGKAECWLALDAKPGAQLILGHDAASREELQGAIAAGELESHLLRHDVEPGSFFMVPAGAVHAVGPDQLVYEVQQSSDITYRLHDFDRNGIDGRPRELHVEKAGAVMTAPFDIDAALTADQPTPQPWGAARTLVANEHFAVTEYTIDGDAEIETGVSFAMATVVTGSGTLSAADTEHSVTRGTSFVVPARTSEIAIAGDLTVVVTAPGTD